MGWEDWHFGTESRDVVFAMGFAYGQFWQAKELRQLVHVMVPNSIIERVRKVCEVEDIPAAFEPAGEDHTTVILDYRR